jgi:hypothetical protein
VKTDDTRKLGADGLVAVLVWLGATPLLAAVCFLAFDVAWIGLFSERYETWRQRYDHVVAREFLAPRAEEFLRGGGERKLQSAATDLLPGVRVVVRDSDTGSLLFDSRPVSATADPGGWQGAPGHLPIPLDPDAEMELHYPTQSSALSRALEDFRQLFRGGFDANVLRSAQVTALFVASGGVGALLGVLPAVAAALWMRERRTRRRLERLKAQESAAWNEYSAKLRQYEQTRQQSMKELARRDAEIERLEQRIADVERQLVEADSRQDPREMADLEDELEQAERERDAQLSAKGPEDPELAEELSRLQATLEDVRRQIAERTQERRERQAKTGRGQKDAAEAWWLLWDPEVRWSTRARRERAAVGQDQNVLVTLLALCAVDHALSERFTGEEARESFRRRLYQCSDLDRGERQFLSYAWRVRNHMVHLGEMPPPDFDTGRLCGIAQKLGARPITTGWHLTSARRTESRRPGRGA